MNLLLEIAIKASIDAGKEILKVYNTTFEVETKEDNSPLTIADKNANEVINRYLLPTGIPIVSEENKQIDYLERKNWSRCWMVDPLDGTKEFVKRNGEFTVNIALIENGKPILGVIYVPVSKELYFSGGTKAYKIELEEKQTLKTIIANALILKTADWITPIKVVGSRSHLNEATQKYVEQLGKKNEVKMVSKGSSLKFCLVAEGNAHVYPRFAPTMEWDTAAGQAICEAVGLKVINQETNSPLTYNKENLLNPYFLVSV